MELDAKTVVLPDDIAEVIRRRLPPGWSYAVHPGEDEKLNAASDVGVSFSYGTFEPLSFQYRWRRTLFVPIRGDSVSGMEDSKRSIPKLNVVELVIDAANRVEDASNGFETERSVTSRVVKTTHSWTVAELMRNIDPAYDVSVEYRDACENGASLFVRASSLHRSAVELDVKKKKKKKKRFQSSEGHPIGKKFTSNLKCKMCGEGFHFAEAFVRFGLHEPLLSHYQHKHKHHQKTPKRGHFKCSCCDKSFTFEYLLKRHEAKKHDANNYQPTKTDKGEFVCKICDKVLSQLRHLERHIRLVHDSMPDDRPFVCELCQKAFKTKFNLTKHHKTHQERPYKCEQCGAAFCAKCELTYHEIIHTGEKPFLCQQCGKGFNTKTYLHQHQVKVCKVKKSTTVKRVNHNSSGAHRSTELKNEREATDRSLPSSMTHHSNVTASTAVHPTGHKSPPLFVAENIAADPTSDVAPSKPRHATLTIDGNAFVPHPETAQSRDSIFAPASLSWHDVTPGVDFSLTPLSHFQTLPPPILTSSIVPTPTTNFSTISTAATVAPSSVAPPSLPLSLPSSLPLADTLTSTLANDHADLSVHILPETPSSHQTQLNPILTMPSPETHLRLSFTASQQNVPGQANIEIQQQDSLHYRGQFQ